MKDITLGMPGKKLGFGLMRLPVREGGKAGEIDWSKSKMVDHFMEKGFTYFDTAWMYCGFQSEPTVKEALVSRYPRESFTLATKLNAGFFDSPGRPGQNFQPAAGKNRCGIF